MEKGLSEKEADYKRNSMRPIKKEYWIEKGLDEEDAIIKALETKKSNDKKAIESSKKRTKADCRVKSKRTLDYWLLYHLGDIELAKQSLKEAQGTFSLKKCIAKYGNDEGYKVWKTRQEKWQKTLHSKSESEKKKINYKKANTFDNLIEKGYTRNEAIDYLIAKNRIQKLHTEDDLINFIKSLINNTPINFIYKKLCDSIKQIYDIRTLDSFIEYCYNKNIDISFNTKIVKNPRGFWNMKTEYGLLRSSYEIEFYYCLLEKGITNFIIEKQYDNSSMYSDFYIADLMLHIEIAPNYGKKGEEKYTLKMDKKKKLFGSIILTDDKDLYIDFIQELKVMIDEKQNN